MPQELTLVFTAVISALAALGGVALTWALGNISAESKDRRLEREAWRHRLEDRYLQILTDIDIFLRRAKNGVNLDESLSALGAAILISAGAPVRDSYGALAVAIQEMLDAVEGSKALMSYADEHPAAWGKINNAKLDLAATMRSEIEALRNFST